MYFCSSLVSYENASPKHGIWERQPVEVRYRHATYTCFLLQQIEKKSHLSGAENQDAALSALDIRWTCFLKANKQNKMIPRLCKLRTFMVLGFASECKYQVLLDHAVHGVISISSQAWCMCLKQWACTFCEKWYTCSVVASQKDVSRLHAAGESLVLAPLQLHKKA